VKGDPPRGQPGFVGHIALSKVRDGVADCNDGEDERDGAKGEAAPHPHPVIDPAGA
jgi:hypothetical protein